MSTLTADPKFDRGHVLGIKWAYYDSVNQPQDLQIGDGNTVKGTHSVFRDEHPYTGVLFSNATVECVAVKNVSGAELNAGESVQLDPDAVFGETGGAVATAFGIVDEYLTAPVKDGEVCWVVVRGPTVVNGSAPTGTVASGSPDADGNQRVIVIGSDAHGM